MKKTLSTIAVALLALTGCTAQAEPSVQEKQTVAPSSTPTKTIAPAISTPTQTPAERHVVTYKATAKYADGTDAPMTVQWISIPLSDFTDTTGDWEGMVSDFKSGGYASVSVTPKGFGIDIRCTIFVDGTLVSSHKVDASATMANCKYTLP